MYWLPCINLAFFRLVPLVQQVLCVTLPIHYPAPKRTNPKSVCDHVQLQYVSRWPNNYFRIGLFFRLSPILTHGWCGRWNVAERARTSNHVQVHGKKVCQIKIKSISAKEVNHAVSPRLIGPSVKPNGTHINIVHFNGRHMRLRWHISSFTWASRFVFFSLPSSICPCWVKSSFSIG